MTFAALLQNFVIPFQWWVVVAPWERAVRARRGKHASVLGPGFHFKIPFVDRISIVSVRLRTISDTGQTMRTKDGKPLTVNIAVQYTITDALRLFETIANPEMTLILTAMGAVAKTVGENNLADITHRSIESDATSALPAEKWGIGEVAVKVTSLVSARTYRLMMHEYRSYSGLDQTLSADDDKRIRA